MDQKDWAFIIAVALSGGGASLTSLQTTDDAEKIVRHKIYKAKKEIKNRLNQIEAQQELILDLLQEKDDDGCND